MIFTRPRLSRFKSSFIVLTVVGSASLQCPLRGQWLPSGATSGPIHYAGGNVGIGTASPPDLFDVNGDAVIGSQLNGGTNVALNTGGPAHTRSISVYYDLAHESGIISSANGGVAYVPLLLNPSGGNVGIGTLAPTSGGGQLGTLLNVNSVGNFNTVLVASTGAIGGSNFGGSFEVKSNLVVPGEVRLGQIAFFRGADVTAGQISSNMVMNLNNDGTLVDTLDEYLSGGSTVAQFGRTTPASSFLHLFGGGGAFTAELQGDPNGNFLINANGVTAGVFQVVRTGAAPNTMVLNGGNVGINTATPCKSSVAPANCKLSVNGAIQATAVVVNTGWSDYVFAPDYKLQPLRDVAAFIGVNHHLPNIPSAAEVAERGVDIGDMQSKLLAKIEELTLHMIQIEKENNDLTQRLAKVERRQSR